MKCIKCGYESAGQFSQCPVCGTVQSQGQKYYYANTPPAGKAVKQTGGEIAAVIIAIVVSVFSLIAAFVILIAYSTITSSKISSDDDFGIDAFDDFDSNEYGDDIEDFFNEYYNKNDKNGFKSPAGLNLPLKFEETLYSFSEGEIKTEYEVSVINTYRGEAAVKLLDGEALPRYDEDEYDVYLVKFLIKITDQEKDAIVVLPTGNPAAYKSGSDSLFSNEYEVIDGLNYENKKSLIKKGESIETWLAFIVDKEDHSPLIMWNRYENKAFQNKGAAISNADTIEAGAALEKKSESESESESEAESETSSN